MEAPAKGKVTPLESLFPSGEAQKAAERVKEKIVEQQNEMNRLNQFITDNANLINLVKKLPDQLHHDIMVPFGKKAFFPGRLMHTNEFLVFLGENYYVERTSKQTVDVLRRRGKNLKSQVQSLKAIMQDLEAEASFFSATASEAAEGLVEIREDYVEETSELLSKPGVEKHISSSLIPVENVKAEAEDEDFARMMSKLDELEMEELEDEMDEESDEDQESDAREDESESDVVEEEQTEAVLGKGLDHSSLDRKPNYSEEFQSLKLSQHPRDVNAASERLPDKYQHCQDLGDRLNCTGLGVQHFPKEETSGSRILSQSFGTSKTIQMASTDLEAKAETGTLLSPRNELPVQKSKPEFDSSKAFTGSIIEHDHNLQPKAEGQTLNPSQSSGAQPSKPVSRFKMLRK